MKPITDEELMLQAQRGNPAGFSILDSRYRDAMVQYLHWRLANVRNVESICDDVFLRARRSIGTFRYPQRFSTWIFTIAYYATK